MVENRVGAAAVSGKQGVEESPEAPGGGSAVKELVSKLARAFNGPHLRVVIVLSGKRVVQGRARLEGLGQLLPFLVRQLHLRLVAFAPGLGRDGTGISALGIHGALDQPDGLAGHPVAAGDRSPRFAVGESLADLLALGRRQFPASRGGWRIGHGIEGVRGSQVGLPSECSGVTSSYPNRWS